MRPGGFWMRPDTETPRSPWAADPGLCNAEPKQVLPHAEVALLGF